jgi:hypothetical protein
VQARKACEWRTSACGDDPEHPSVMNKQLGNTTKFVVLPRKFRHKNMLG